MTQFRTRTGQTGLDAYLNEAGAIANEQRDLNERFRSLCAVVHAEAPELFDYSTDYHPELLSFGESNPGKGLLEHLLDRR